MLRVAAFTELVVGYVVWSLVFVRAFRHARGHKKAARAAESRWGIFLQTIGFAFAWAYVRPASFLRPAPFLILSMVLVPFSILLAWAAVHHLGKHWRYEAALSEDHELIRSGPYHWIRHPIYTSMLGMTLATLAGWTWWPMAIAALIFFLAGTEVRIRAEDRLLAGRFGEAFSEYQKSTPALIPFLR
jgi:protein-S-isoprenylcysteine O-methyltransferase Ste14